MIKIDEFDKRIELAATKLAVIFRTFGWTWGLTKGDGVPTENDIERTLERLIEDLNKSPRSNGIGTGRIWIERQMDADREEFAIYLDIASLHEDENENISESTSRE